MPPNKVETLAKQTPHRVVRNSTSSSSHIGRAYADSVPNYVPANNGLASANINASSPALWHLQYDHFRFGGSFYRVWTRSRPRLIADLGDPANDPARFITNRNETSYLWEQFRIISMPRHRHGTARHKRLRHPVDTGATRNARRLRPTFIARSQRSGVVGRPATTPSWKISHVGARIPSRLPRDREITTLAADSWLSLTSHSDSTYLSSDACHAAAELSVDEHRGGPPPATRAK